MVEVNPSAFIPQDVFVQLNIEDLEDVLALMDVLEMEAEFDGALKTNRLETVAVADLILALLLKNRDAAASDITEKLYNALNSQQSGVSSYQWQNTLVEVIPYAVLMRKWSYLDQFIARQMLEPAATCALLTLAAHVCLAKERYPEASKYLSQAKVLAETASLASTAEIDDLAEYAEAKLIEENHITMTSSQDVDEPNNLNFDPSLEELDETGRVLRRWQLHFGVSSKDKSWQEAEDLSFLFQRFRPQGLEVEQFCTEMGCCAIAPRLLEIFQATSSNYPSEKPFDAYFVVRAPQPATDEELLSLSNKYLNSIKEVATRISDGDSDMEAAFSALSTIAIRRGCEPPAESSYLQAAVNEALHDYFCRFQLGNPGATLLKEALYTMACDYNLVHYVLWPIAQANFEQNHTDPYSPYFELWKRGVDFRFEDQQSAILYVADPIP